MSAAAARSGPSDQAGRRVEDERHPNAARWRPSRTRSHDVTPSRSARSTGSIPSSASQPSTRRGSVAQRSLPAAGARRAPGSARRRRLGWSTLLPRPGPALPGRFASTCRRDGTVRRPPKSAGRSPRGPHVAADPDAAGMTARLPTTVMPVLSRRAPADWPSSKSSPSADDGVRADRDLLVDDRAVDDGTGADDRVEHDDAVADDGAGVDPDAGRQHRALDRARDEAAVADQRAVDVGGRPDSGRRPLLRAGVDDPVAVVEVELRVVIEQLHVRLPVALDGADVLPVAVEPIAEDARAAVEHRRDDVAAEVGPQSSSQVEQRLLARRRRCRGSRGRSSAAWASPATR